MIPIQSDTDTDRSTSPSSSTLISSELTKKSRSEHEIEPDIEEEPSQPLHILSLMQRNHIEFKVLHRIENRWERLLPRVELTHAIESFRDAIMIPANDKIVIFNMRNGSISQAQYLIIETAAMENITLPNDIGGATLALFCLLNDKIYCFARTDQQLFHR